MIHIKNTCCFTGPRIKNLPWGNEDEAFVNQYVKERVFPANLLGL